MNSDQRDSTKDSADTICRLIAENAEVRAEVDRLREAIRMHRDQRGDDRCWQDDHTLYDVLPEGYEPPAVDSAVMLENCQRYIACRQGGTEYVSPQRRIEQLEAELVEANRRAALWERLHDAARDAYRESVWDRLETVGAVRTKDAMPEPHQLVIVEGGCAVWTGSVWLSYATASLDTDRNLLRAVSWWMAIPTGRDLIQEQSMKDLTASGGIVGAP